MHTYTGNRKLTKILESFDNYWHYFAKFVHIYSSTIRNTVQFDALVRNIWKNKVIL